MTVKESTSKSEKVAIMQPYFFPYIGYFQLINMVDEFILFDTPQFIRHGWIERNNLIQLNGNKFYIKVPLIKDKRETKIFNKKINNNEDWKGKILAQLNHYKKKAPYFEETLQLVQNAMDFDTDSISMLNHHIIILICEYLKINTPIKVYSQMELEIEEVIESDEWALNICKVMKAKRYINPIGGKAFFNREKFESEGIKVDFLNSLFAPYEQFNHNFVPGLSIIDVMMFNSPEEIRKMLNQYELI